MNAERKALLAIIIAWALIALPGLLMGFHADDWFQIRPRDAAQVFATFTGDWNIGAQGTGGFYRPLMRVGIAIDRAIWGSHAFGYHLSNALVFLTLLIGVYRLSFVLTGGKRRCSVAATILLAASPLKNEALYWISARADILAATFAIWATWSALRAAVDDSMPRAFGALALLACALLSKEVAAAAAVIIPICVALLRPSGKFRAVDFALIAAPLVMVAAWIVFRQRVLGGIGGYYGELSEPLQLMNIARSIGRMLAALFAPGTGYFFGAWLPLGGLAWGSAAVLLLIQSQIYRPYAAMLAAVVLALAPMGGLPCAPLNGERVLLLALSFQCACAAVIFARCSERPILRMLGVPIFALIVATHLVLSLSDARAFVAAKDRTSEIVETTGKAIESSAPGSRFVVLDPPDSVVGRRFLTPGMAMLMAMVTRAEANGYEVTLDGVEIVRGGGAGASRPQQMTYFEWQPDYVLKAERFGASVRTEYDEEMIRNAASGGGGAESFVFASDIQTGLVRVRTHWTGNAPSMQFELRGEGNRVIGAYSMIHTSGAGKSRVFTGYAVAREPVTGVVLNRSNIPVGSTLTSLQIDNYR